MALLSIVRARCPLAWPLVLAVATCATAGYAQTTPNPSEAPAVEAAREPTSDQLAEEAFRAYEGGDFAGSIGLYLRSFQGSGDARVLYNVASIYDKKLHDRKLAEDYYRRYLKSTATEPDLVKKANDRLVEMKNEQETLRDNADAQAPAVAPADRALPPPPHESASRQKPIGLVLAGIGIVGAGVGAVFGISALSKSDELSRQCPGDVCRDAAGPTLRDDASNAATLSTIFFVGGLALIAGGAALYLLAPNPKKTTGLSVRPVLDASRASLSLSGSF